VGDSVVVSIIDSVRCFELFKGTCKSWHDVAVAWAEDHFRQVFRRRFPFACRDGGELDEEDSSDWSLRAARWRYDYPDQGSQACSERIYVSLHPPNSSSDRAESYEDLVQAMIRLVTSRSRENTGVAAPVARDRKESKMLGSAQRWVEHMRGTAPTVTLLFMGLDRAGKTTTVFLLDTESNAHRRSSHYNTIGNPVTVWYIGNATVWEIGIGRQYLMDKVRPLYRHLYQHTDCVCWVINACSTSEELDLSARHLHAILNENAHIKAGMREGIDIPVLIIINRLNHLEAHSLDEVIETHQLDAFKEDTPRCFGSYLVHVVACNDDDPGNSVDIAMKPSRELLAGFEWLEGVLPEFKLDGKL